MAAGMTSPHEHHLPGRDLIGLTLGTEHGIMLYAGVLKLDDELTSLMMDCTVEEVERVRDSFDEVVWRRMPEMAMAHIDVMFLSKAMGGGEDLRLGVQIASTVRKRISGEGNKASAFDPDKFKLLVEAASGDNGAGVEYGVHGEDGAHVAA